MNEMKVLFKGGYPAPLLNGLQTVNCGAHIEINNKKYEQMGNDISGHRSDIISKYIRTCTGKVEISIWKQDQSVYSYGIAYYREAGDNQSFRYTQKIPKKYQEIKDELKEVYQSVIEKIAIEKI